MRFVSVVVMRMNGDFRSSDVSSPFRGTSPIIPFCVRAAIARRGVPKQCKGVLKEGYESCLLSGAELMVLRADSLGQRSETGRWDRNVQA